MILCRRTQLVGGVTDGVGKAVHQGDPVLVFSQFLINLYF